MASQNPEQVPPLVAVKPPVSSTHPRRGATTVTDLSTVRPSSVQLALMPFSDPILPKVDACSPSTRSAFSRAIRFALLTARFGALLRSESAAPLPVFRREVVAPAELA